MTGLRPNFAGYNDALGRAVRLGDGPAVAAGSDLAGLDAALDAEVLDPVAAGVFVPENFEPQVQKPEMRKAAATKVAALKNAPIDVGYKQSAWVDGKRAKTDETASIDGRVLYDQKLAVGGENPAHSSSRSRNNFVGVNYHKDRGAGEVAGITRKVLKDALADPAGPLRHVSKVSVRSSGNHVVVSMHLDHEPRVGEDYPSTHQPHSGSNWLRADAETQPVHALRDREHKWANLTPQASEAKATVEAFLKSMNYDRSESQSDLWDAQFTEEVNLYSPYGPTWKR